MVAHITVVGSLNMDLIIRSPRIPRPGETILGGELHTAAGGKGANQAVAAARLGGRVSMIGRVGPDPFASELLDNMATANIDNRFVFRDPQVATGVALIVVDDAGENNIVVASGANMQLSPNDIENAKDAILDADVLLLQLEIPLDTNLHAAEIARSNRVKVVLNPAPAQKLPDELLALVDILIPNQTESALLTGLPLSSEAEVEKAAQSLLQTGIGAVIITMGDRGAMLATKGKVERYPAFEVKPVDTTAAGDAFVGGFGLAWAEGKSLSEAIRFGSAAGALATTRLGAQPSLPTRQEVEEMLKINPGVF